MQIQVLFDKQAVESNIRTGWGLSFLVDNKILFDTGEKGEWLLDNMRILGVDLAKIEAVVISHDHWDHWGGLWDLLSARPGMKVYICQHFSKEFKEKAVQLQAQLIECQKNTEIIKNIFVTGEIPGAYHGKYMAEQALLLRTNNGITVITGCAHPGILKIIEKAKLYFSAEPFYLVMGGFHLMESDKRAVEIIAESFKTMGIRKAGPTHCTGHDAANVFKKFYGQEDFISIQAGQVIEV